MNYFLKQRWWAIAIILLFIANLATLTFFWVSKPPRPSGFPPPPVGARGEPPRFLVNKLHFTQEQTKQYDQLFRQHDEQVSAIKDSIRDTKERLFELLNTANPAADEVRRRAAKSADFQRELDEMTFEHFMQVRGICTPEQQKEFDVVIIDVVKHIAPAPPPPPPVPGTEQQTQGAAPPPADH